VVYTLDFVEAGKLRDLFEAHGIKDAEVIQISVSRLTSKNTFDVEPAPWIVSGRNERE
jgi:precorrin-6Y C5,15-methyltransferase (decarboxylating)